MKRGTTCRCAACASIGSLDLKFVAHYGTYVLSVDGDREDLAGPDVILVHRLLKNTVGDGGGPQAYAFLTDPCLQRMPPSFDLPSHSESYESFGQTTGGVHDLKPVVAQMREARRVYIGSEDADVEISFGEHPYPPAVVWQYFVDPEKRLRWQPLQTAVKNQPNQQGRLGPGASSHCAHGRPRRRAARIPRLAPVQLLHQPLHAPGSRAALLPLHRDLRVHPHRRRNDGPLPVSTRGSRTVDAAPVPDPPARRSQDADPVRRNAREDPRRGRRHQTRRRSESRVLSGRTHARVGIVPHDRRQVGHCSATAPRELPNSRSLAFGSAVEPATGDASGAALSAG